MSSRSSEVTKVVVSASLISWVIFFVRAAGGGELLQAAGMAGGLAEFDHCLDAVPRLLGAGFEQGEEAVFLTKESCE